MIWRTRGRAHVFGDNLPHDGGIVPMRVIPMRLTDPDAVVPYLFEEHRPSFRDQVKRGDFVVSGVNFGCGKPHTAGYLGMKALDVRVLCESAPYVVVRALMNTGVPCMHQCVGIRDLVADGDDIEVDYTSGEVVNHTRADRRSFAPLDHRVRELIEQGGMEGMLRIWLQKHPELGTAV